MRRSFGRIEARSTIRRGVSHGVFDCTTTCLKVSSRSKIHGSPTTPFEAKATYGKTYGKQIKTCVHKEDCDCLNVPTEDNVGIVHNPQVKQKGLPCPHHKHIGCCSGAERGRVYQDDYMATPQDTYAHFSNGRVISQASEESSVPPIKILGNADMHLSTSPPLTAVLILSLRQNITRIGQEPSS